MKMGLNSKWILGLFFGNVSYSFSNTCYATAGEYDAATFLGIDSQLKLIETILMMYF